ncbi:DUF4145 domain-containing protein [Ferrimonas marina]|uniref:TPR repeat n=1 Tax=Ferrimonas marina TaxID=299255 RepID=A0A1M5ZAY4_9GAMM|nr:DUF4145 domain-containing protein [Ferrimonas marina]SHI21401.1 TPR repeat [Ferrimonas marina]
MNDLELIRQLDRQLVDDYQLARNYCLDVPTYALVHLRSVAHKITTELGRRAEVEFRSKNLYDRIEQLAKGKQIDMRLARKLHKLRNDGNKGAHPEKYRLSPEQLVQLAAKSVKDTARLAAELFPLLTGQPAPHWQFEPVDAEAGRELCYRAVMQDDAEAQYLVGLSLKSRGLMKRQREHSFALANNSTSVDLEPSQDDLRQAAHWFARAADRHAGARFEHGVALLHGYGEGEGSLALIQAAAEAGNADALALLGYFAQTGSHGHALDPALAERYLLAAVEQDQPEAMANLAVLYYQGSLGQPDWQRARHYAEQGAQAGYPHAQYQLAVMLFAGEGGNAEPESALQWLRQAAEQHYPEALADLAQRTLDGDGVEANPAAAASLYREAIRFGRLPRAMFELALAHFDGEVPDRDLAEAAQLLHGAYRYAPKGSELAEAIWQLAPELVRQLDRAEPEDEGAAEALAQGRALFDPVGYPLGDRH